MRYTGPKCRLCRREGEKGGEKLFLKGDRCHTQKCAVTRRNTVPGKGAKERAGKLSEYGKQLREKQKAKRIFGLSEKTFRKYYKKAGQRKGVTGDNLLRLLEMRLDNIIYRSGMTDSRSQARQMVNHGIFELNGKKVDIPSMLVRPEDKITVAERAMKHPVIAAINDRKTKPPKWMKVNVSKKEIEILRYPETEEFENSIAISLIVEFYSR